MNLATKHNQPFKKVQVFIPAISFNAGSYLSTNTIFTAPTELLIKNFTCLYSQSSNVNGLLIWQWKVEETNPFPLTNDFGTNVPALIAYTGINDQENKIMVGFMGPTVSAGTYMPNMKKAKAGSFSMKKNNVIALKAFRFTNLLAQSFGSMFITFDAIYA